MSQKKMQMCKHFSSQPEKKTLDTGRLWQSCSVLLHHSWFWGVSDSTRIYPYLESTETKKLFKPVDDEMDVLNAINNQMEWLPTIIDDCKGYWCLVSVLERMMTAHQKFMVYVQNPLLFCSLYHAKEMMSISQNWDMCHQKAVQHMLLCGVKAWCARTRRNLYWILGRKIGILYDSSQEAQASYFVLKFRREAEDTAILQGALT
jgi:hypothetical protein